MSLETAERGPILAVFADATAPGDADFPDVLAATGALLGEAGARIVCLSTNGAYCLPLVDAACTAGAEVTILSDGVLEPGGLAVGTHVEVIAEEDARLQHLSETVDAFVGLPAGIATMGALFNVWVLAGGGSSGKPVALLNRNRAFEVLRGYAMDVVSHSLTNSDRLVLFADTVEDLWARLDRALAQS